MPEIEVAEPEVLPAPNAFDLLVEGFAAVNDPSAVSFGGGGLRRDPETGELYELASREKEMLVMDNGEALALVREALDHQLAYPDPYMFFQGRGDIHIGDIRLLGRLLALESQVHKENGRFGAAVQSALDCMELGRLIGQRFPVIAALTGVALTGMGAENLPAIIPELDREELKAAQARLQKMERMRFDMREILSVDRDLGLRLLEALISGADWRKEIAKMTTLARMDPEELPNGLFEEIEPGDLPLRKQLEIRMRSWAYHRGSMFSAYEEMMGEAINAVEKPFPRSEGLFPGPNRRLPPMMDDARGLRLVWFSILVSETRHEMLKAQVALRLWNLEHGLYPETLEDLVASYLARLPDDPFAEGEALRYHTEDNSYLLYSVGPDGNDGGGVPMEKRGFDGERRYIPQSHLPGDIVAGVNLLRVQKN